jgi:hypothetical protein
MADIDRTGGMMVVLFIALAAIPIRGGCFHFGNPRCSSDRQDHRNQMRPSAPAPRERVLFFDFDFQKRRRTPTSKKPLKPAVVV